MGDKTTFVLTVLGGVSVFLVGQIALKMILEPCQEMKRILGNTSHLLLYHQAKITNASANNDIATELKLKSAQIVSQTDVILLYSFVRFFFWLPSKRNVLKASHELNLLSHGMHSVTQPDESLRVDVARDNAIAVREIGKLLDIRTTYGNTK